MKPDLRERLSRSDRFTREIRAFFAGNGHVEVDTPCLSPFLIPEPAIEVFRTVFHPASGAEVELYLAPSPELWMKRLIAAGSGSIFQVARSFRDGDFGGPLHNPEFRLLEWYTVGASYRDQVATTEELVARLLSTDPPAAHAERLRPPFRIMSMEQAFRDFAGMDLARCTATGDMIEAARSRGADARDGWTWEQAFHGAFLAAVEPGLPRDRPLVLTDWPAAVPTTARRRTGHPVGRAMGAVPRRGRGGQLLHRGDGSRGGRPVPAPKRRSASAGRPGWCPGWTRGTAASSRTVSPPVRGSLSAWTGSRWWSEASGRWRG